MNHDSMYSHHENIKPVTHRFFTRVSRKKGKATPFQVGPAMHGDNPAGQHLLSFRQRMPKTGAISHPINFHQLGHLLDTWYLVKLFSNQRSRYRKAPVPPNFIDATDSISTLVLLSWRNDDSSTTAWVHALRFSFSRFENPLFSILWTLLLQSCICIACTRGTMLFAQSSGSEFSSLHC